MHRRIGSLLGLTAGLMMPVMFAAEPEPAVRPGGRSADAAWKPSRTPEGRPDFQGTWVNNTATPFFRPTALADKPTLTDQELAVLKQRAARIFNGDGDTALGDELFETLLKNPDTFVTARATGDFNQFWTEQNLAFEHRTSQIVDPPNGRLPPLTPEAERRQAARVAWLREHPADGPEDRLPRERCIVMGAIKVGFLQSRAMSYFKVVQTPSLVLLQSEANHDTRLIPVSGGPHAPEAIRRWLGDSRGHWEGDTLVVDTTNFHRQSVLRVAPQLVFPAERLHTIERLSQIGPDTMQYHVTIEDSTTWTRPWSAMTTWQRTNARMFEDACHEGNYGMEGLLRGARADEKARTR